MSPTYDSEARPREAHPRPQDSLDAVAENALGLINKAAAQASENIKTAYAISDFIEKIGQLRPPRCVGLVCARSEGEVGRGEQNRSQVLGVAHTLSLARHSAVALQRHRESCSVACAGGSGVAKSKMYQFALSWSAPRFILCNPS